MAGLWINEGEVLGQSAEWTFLELSFASSHRPKTTFANQEVAANVPGLQKLAEKTADTCKACRHRGFRFSASRVESFLGLPLDLGTSKSPVRWPTTHSLISQASPFQELRSEAAQHSGRAKTAVTRS